MVSFNTGTCAVDYFHFLQSAIKAEGRGRDCCVENCTFAKPTDAGDRPRIPPPAARWVFYENESMTKLIEQQQQNPLWLFVVTTTNGVFPIQNYVCHRRGYTLTHCTADASDDESC